MDARLDSNLSFCETMCLEARARFTNEKELSALGPSFPLGFPLRQSSKFYFGPAII